MATTGAALSRTGRPMDIHTVRKLQRAFVYVLLAAGTVIFILPFLWMLTTSLKTSRGVLTFPPQFFPTSFEWPNYPEGWSALPFNRFLLNTLLVTTLAVVGNLISCTLPAYAFARLRARGRPIMFAAMLATMAIPAEVTLVPQFILFTELHMVNTYWPLFLPAWFGYAYFIFLLRQFFMTIPRELDEAARIDGAGDLRILWSIILPLSKPAIAAVTVFAFIGNWNNLIAPLIYLRSQEKYTLALGLKLFQGQFITQYNQMMAVSIITLLPIVVLFFIAQKAFVRGITLTGMGGR
jgi:ABC-type glycerol-3-phosphate transport system permease component